MSFVICRGFTISVTKPSIMNKATKGKNDTLPKLLNLKSKYAFMKYAIEYAIKILLPMSVA